MTTTLMTRQDAKTRARDNLDWYVDLLCGDVEIPGSVFRIDPDDETIAPDTARRFTASWRNPHQLLVHVVMRHNNNEDHQPFDRAAVWREGDVICMRDSIGHIWKDDFSFDEDGNISGLVVRGDLVNDYQARLMEPRDVQAIEDMNQVARIQVGDGKCTIDRKGATRHYLKLLEDNLVAVVDDKYGNMVSVGGASLTTLRIDGTDYFLQYTNHFRTHRDHRNFAMMRSLFNLVCVPRYAQIDGTLFVMHGRNERMLATAPSLWQEGAYRAVFDCAQIAGSPAGRPVQGGELAGIADLLNQTHGGQEFYLPYDLQRFADRLSRCPEAYSTANLRRTDRAFLGTWFSGEARSYDMPDGSWTETRGLILDYGCEAGGADELEQLIRAAAREALDQGITHLSLFVSDKSRPFARISNLADHLELYRVNCSIAEPASAAMRGIYIDPVLV